jgi:predicted nucleotidyltransferase
MVTNDMRSESEIIRTLLDLDREGLVRFIIVYGSVSRGDSRDGSDLDICVYYDAGPEKRQGYRVRALEELFSDDIDIHIFQDLPLQVRNEVLKGRVLHSDDDVFLHDVAYHQIREFDDFKQYLYDYLGMERIR